MNLDNFINNYKGTVVDWDNAYGAQCVDLARAFINYVAQMYQPCAVESAYQCFNRWADFKCFKKILKKVSAEQLRRGDLAIWNKTSTNPHGHIAIVMADKGDNLLIFEQNGFKQDGAKISSHTKSGLMGGLRVCNFKNGIATAFFAKEE